MPERDIAVISFGNTKLNPYLQIHSHAANSYPLLYLGNQIGLHFQSVLPAPKITATIISLPETPSFAATKTTTTATVVSLPPETLVQSSLLQTSLMSLPETSKTVKVGSKKKVLFSPVLPMMRKTLIDMKEIINIGQ